MKELVLSAHERAVRNCPWTVKLWNQYLLAMERHQAEHGLILGKDKAAILSPPGTSRKARAKGVLMLPVCSLLQLETFEKALNAGFIQATDYVEIWQAYLDYLRRRVDFTQGKRVPVLWSQECCVGCPWASVCSLVALLTEHSLHSTPIASFLAVLLLHLVSFRF